MLALLIDPANQRIDPIEYDGSLAALAVLIGYFTLESDEIDANGDRLFFDEECFLRAVPGAGRFQLDTLAPVAGRAVVVGSPPGAAQASAGFGAPRITPAALSLRVRFS